MAGRLNMKIWWVAAALALTSVGCSEEVVEPEQHEDLSQEAIEAWDSAFNEGEDGKSDSLRCSGVKVPDTGGFEKRVALTFDDGPNASTTPKVLDILAEHGIKATFFINGRRVTSDDQRAILKRMVEEGHVLANHSHEHKNLKNVSERTLDEQIRLTDNIMREVIETPQYFRFPFGSSNCKTADHVRSYGYIVTGWHVDSADWCFASGTGGVGHCAESTFKWVPDGFRDDMVGYTLSQTRSKNGGILLFHDIHQNTVDNLEPIIKGLQEGGFTFVNIDDVEAFPKLHGTFEPEVPRPHTGDGCTEDANCDFTSGENQGSCHAFSLEGSEEVFGFCTVECEGFCEDRPGRSGTFCVSLNDGLTGNCVPKADDVNGECLLLPGTVPTEAERFIGNSGAFAATATVCLPK